MALFKAVLPLIAYLGTFSPAYSPQTDYWQGWFSDLKPISQLPLEEGLKILEAARNGLEKGRLIPAQLPLAWRHDKLPRMVFISHTFGLQSASIAMGRGYGLTAALTDAISQLRVNYPPGMAPGWLILDLVGPVRPISPPGQWVKTHDFGFEGLAGLAGEELAILPAEMLAYHLWDGSEAISPSRLIPILKARGKSRRHLTNGPWPGKSRNWAFKTQAYFAVGQQSGPLFRGHRNYQQLDQQNLETAIDMAAAYLHRSVLGDGRLRYLYHSPSSSAGRRYSIARHAGTLFAMADYYQYHQNSHFLKAVDRGFAYLNRTQQTLVIDGNTYPVWVESQRVNMEAMALALVAYCEYALVTGNQRDLPIMTRLANYLRVSQKETGRFLSSRAYPSGKPLSGYSSEYAQGQAILALAKFSELSADTGFLDAACLGINYVIGTRDRGVNPAALPHDHWLLYALEQVNRLRPTKDYRIHAARIAQAIAAKQRHNDPVADVNGSYLSPPGSASAATRSEGLAAACRLLQAAGAKRQIAPLLKALKHGIVFQLNTMFQPEKTIYLPQPQMALGGFHGSLTDYQVRIDFVQHNLSAMLALKRILQKHQPRENPQKKTD